MAVAMSDEDATPEAFFVHPRTARLANVFFFYAYGNTPPTDLLQHIPHDAARADILSLGCGDLRDFLYSIQLHGRRGVSCGPVPRQLTFTFNDWEPAIHARNLIMLQLILDSRNLLEVRSAETDMLVDAQMEAMDVSGSEVSSASAEAKAGEAVRQTKTTENSKTSNTKAGSRAGQAPSEGGLEHNAPFAQRIGVIFSAMYNVFVDADVLQTIQLVAGKLAASAGSPEEWSSTELGSIVYFADERSQDRVRDILTIYADKGLQGRVSASRVRRERNAAIAERIFVGAMGTTIESGAMGLASLRGKVISEVHNEMAKKNLAEGVLDPFPLLLAGTRVRLKRAPCKFVNPLLLVTETKGTTFSLHYGAFPLEAFHTEVTSWELRNASKQAEHGKLAPSVLKLEDPDTRSCKVGRSTASSRRGVQYAWFGAALEQLAQMCGGLLAATRTTSVEPGVGMASATPHLRINIHAGDAINLCDAILASWTTSPTAGRSEGGVGFGANSSSSSTFKGIAFQQGTLQPLRLRKDAFTGPRAEFDVISTSNLADHLGIVNILVASAPLLRPATHSVLLVSYMSSAPGLLLFKDTTEFYEKLLCMSSQAAAILLGVVPISSLSSVVGHADTTSLVFTMRPKLSTAEFRATSSCPRILRLTFKSPSQASAATVPPSGPSRTLADISPSEFANLTTSIYKAMISQMPTERDCALGKRDRTEKEALFEAATAPQYTSASVGRLLALASRRLRLLKPHFHAALTAMTNESGLHSPFLLQKEQVALFHAMGLSPIPRLRVGSIALNIRRVVLLVPLKKLGHIRAAMNPAIFLSLSKMNDDNDNDDHFMSVHMAFVRVRRGGNGVEDGNTHWRSLSRHLEVRDTRSGDPDAELMVSVVVPRFMLETTPVSQIKVQLRRLDSIGLSQRQVHRHEKVGKVSTMVMYETNLANTDGTAILTPGRPSGAWKASFSSPPLDGLNVALSSRCEKDSPFNSAMGVLGTSDSPLLQRFLHGESCIDQSLELMGQPGRGNDAPLVGRVKLVMANREAREHLAKGETPHVEATLNPCSLRVVLGKELIHVTLFPFPVVCKGVRVVYSKSQGYAIFTALPLEGLIEVPFALKACSVEDDGPRRPLSTFCWPTCVPLIYLRRLDFNAEWAHHTVMGPMSSHQADLSSHEKASRRSTGGPHVGFGGMKESIRDIAASACATHREDQPVWKHEWACITNDRRHDEPALWVWVNEILLDPSNQALVLDCCIMPVDSMDHEASLLLGAAIGDAATSFIQACRDEFELWTALLPTAVERARQTYAHAGDCIYGNPSDAHPTVCSCSMGKDLPLSFMESMKSVKAMASGASVTTLVFRAALSPLYARPEVAVAKDSVPGCDAGSSVRCAKCGKGGSSKVCSRCRKVRYCSRECQCQDWKNHKPGCAAKPGSATS